MNVGIRIEAFLEPYDDTDKLNNCGLILENYMIDTDEELVEIDSHIVRVPKIEQLIKEYFELLVRVDDDLLGLMGEEISDETLYTLNYDFLDEYFGDILTTAETTTNNKWLIYCADNDFSDIKDYKFVYNFNLLDHVMLKEDIYDFYITILKD